ncbi:MAG: ABC transporter substrate-binding protein [Acetatifactor sp.]
MKKISLLVVLLLTCLTVTGCGRRNQIPDSDRQNIDGLPQWSVSHAPMSEQYEGAAIYDGKIYAYRYREGGISISVFSTDKVEQIESYDIPDVLEVKSISVNDFGQICLWGKSEKGNTFWQVSQNGDISVIEDIKVEELGKFPELINFYADSNGYYYLWYEMSVPCAEVYEDGEEDIYTRLDRIYVKDQQMNTLIYDEIPDSYNNQLLSLVFDEDGSPLLFAKDEEGYYVRKVRTSNREKNKATRLATGEMMNPDGDSIIAYVKEGLLYINEGSLYLYHVSDSQNEKLLELASAGILEEDIIYLGMNDSTIEIIDNYNGFQQSEYTAITKGKKETKQLTLGVMALQPEMRRIIAAYNRYQNNVTIEPIVYVKEDDYNTGIERLTLDIIQGKAPDLISVYGLDYENMAEKGAFSDLYMFMQEDTGLKAEDLLSSVLNVYEMEGHLFTIAPTIRIYTMWGACSTVEGRSGIDAEELMQLLQSKGGDINSIYGFSEDENVLTTLCALNMDKFIDWSDGTCDFTGKEFREMIDFAKEYKRETHDSLYNEIQNGDILLTIGLITSVEDYRLQSELYGENVQFIGYPTESGSGSAVLFSGDQLAINSGSEYQKEAWEFVKYFMQNGYHKSGFPVLKEQFEIVLKESLNEVLTYENGELSKVAKKSYREKDVINIHVFKCEQDDAEAIRALVNNISDKFQYHTEIQKIIDEEVTAYFQGEKEIQEVCEIIQNRVQLYLDEL